MIFEVDKHDVDTADFEILEVDPSRLIHEDLRVRNHLRYLVVECALF